VRSNISATATCSGGCLSGTLVWMSDNNPRRSWPLRSRRRLGRSGRTDDDRPTRWRRRRPQFERLEPGGAVTDRCPRLVDPGSTVDSGGHVARRRASGWPPPSPTATRPSATAPRTDRGPHRGRRSVMWTLVGSSNMPQRSGAQLVELDDTGAVARVNSNGCGRQPHDLFGWVEDFPWHTSVT
jgi:hypothetical protein